MDNEQKLFLIEFLVDRVNIPVVKAIHEEMLPTCTCVSFQILSLPPVKIYQDSTIETCACNDGDTQVFKKGKSCLFALPALVLVKPLANFPVTMSVYKELPPGVLPDVMLIGSCQIELKEVMNRVLRDHAFKIANPCATLKDIYSITTATGQCVGEVKVFIRASCLGKKIVTQFQIPHNRKPYLFKGADDTTVFQCKRIVSQCNEPAKCNCPCPGRSADGGGEPPLRTCCPSPRQEECPPSRPPPVKVPMYSQRPCCPTQSPTRGQQGGCACSKPQPKPRQMDTANCPPCCGKVQPSPGDSCSCGVSKGGPSTRKCGCSVKEQRGCNCGRN